MDGLGPSVASALSPASVEAARLASLFWWMAGGAVLVFRVISRVIMTPTRALAASTRAKTADDPLSSYAFRAPTVLCGDVTS
jgi:hypothetical protein